MWEVAAGEARSPKSGLRTGWLQTTSQERSSTTTTRYSSYGRSASRGRGCLRVYCVQPR